MTATSHVVTGALIGAVIVNPALALPIAFLAHFALDALPHLGLESHTDKTFVTYLGADAGLALAILVALAVLQPHNWQLIALSGIACSSPDLMWLPRWVVEMQGKKPKPMGIIRRFHAKIQWAEKPAVLNATFEFAWLTGAFVLLVQSLKF